MSSDHFKFNLEELGGSVFEVVNGLILGRERGSILFKNDLQMSGVHAQFEVRFDKVFITDLNSTNGVFINAKRIAPDSPFLLKDQDRIQLGTQVFIFTALQSEDGYEVIAEIPKIQFSDDKHEDTVFVPLDKIGKKPK